MKKKVKHGFTLVEIALFLAVTGLLFFGIVMGVQNSLFQQKYNDSIQGFSEFLRTVYSQTMNVENSSTSSGRSNKAIYGKLVTFGEELNLEKNSNKTSDGKKAAIFTYTVIGNIDNSFGSGDTLKELRQLEANVFIEKAAGGFDYAGVADQYFPRWEAGIETTKGWPYEDFVGALLIVRHPRSGTVFTYVLTGETIEVNKTMKNAATSMPNPLLKYLPKSDGTTGSTHKFEIKQVDFCVDPQGGARKGIRRNIRLIEGARNASGVEMIGQDDATMSGKVKVGNRCEE